MRLPALLLSSLLSQGCEANRADDAKPPEQTRAISIAAASDLAEALAALTATFEADTGIKVHVTLGSSGTLAKQIAHGAPFDLFASASPALIDATTQRCDATTRARYAQGILATWTKRGVSALTLDALAHTPTIQRVAIANPAHAPYGQAALDAITRAHLLDALSPKLLYAHHVRHALQLVEDGHADAAITAAPLLIHHPDLATRALLLPPEACAPIRQELIVCPGGKNTQDARDFAAYILSPKGQETLLKHGFLPPTP